MQGFDSPPRLKYMKNDFKISAIVPAFNEEETIKNILELLINHPIVDEVICINDGSTDKTAEVIEDFKKKIIIIPLLKNKGKGHALSKGVEKASGDVILFLDADLGNLTDAHILSILTPLIQKKARAVLGYTMQKEKQFMATNPFSKRITGQRAYFRKDLLPHLKNMAKTKYGIEIYLNNIIPSKDAKKIPLKYVSHSWKHQKYSRNTAIKKYLEQIIDIAQEIGKQEGLLPRDYETIAGIKTIKDTKEIILKINKISNKKVKTTFKKAFAEIFYT